MRLFDTRVGYERVMNAPIDRISLFLPELHAGGAQQFTLDLARCWAGEGRSVHLVCGSATGRLREAVPDGVELIDLKTERVVRTPTLLIAYLRQHPGRACWSFMTHMNLAVVLASRVLSRHQGPVAVHEVARFDAGRDPSAPLRRTAMRAGIRWLYRHADIIAAVSEDVADDVARVGSINRSRVDVMSNAIDVERIRSAAAAPNDHPWFADSSVPVLLAVGRLAPEKDYETLFRAFALLRAKRPLRLIVVGEGPSESALNRLAESLGIAGDVDLVGFQANPFAYMGRADLLVLSSFSEGFGLVIVEAMACGTNVVVTDCGTGPRAILPADFGPLPPTRDPQALAASIEERLRAPLSSDVLIGYAQRLDIKAAAAIFLDRLATAPRRRV